MSDPLELGRLTDRRPPFKYSALARVWFSDTDAQGVVYYGRYLPYFDHARTEYHRHLGGLRDSRPGVRDACVRRRVSRTRPVRRPHRGVRPREQDRTLERDLRVRRLPAARRHADGHGAADARTRGRRRAAARRRCRTSSGRQFEHSRAAISRNERRLGGCGSADRRGWRRSGRHPPRKRRSTDGAG